MTKTISDINASRSGIYYNSRRWIGNDPKHLYHITTEEGLKGIAENKAFIPPEWTLPEIFLTTAPIERLGSFIIRLDEDSMIERGFSPRTVPIDEKRDCDGEHVMTEHGLGTLESYCGCIDEDLWEKFQYPHAGDRCDITEEGLVYVSPLSETQLPEYGELSIEGEPPYRVNEGASMQQTFARVVKSEFELSNGEVKEIIYEDIGDNKSIARKAANAFNAAVISLDEAMNKYSELTGGSTIGSSDA